MKILHAIIAFLIGLLTSYILVVTFFAQADYTSTTDRLFLTLMPALAIGLFLFEFFSPVLQGLKRAVTGHSLPRYLLGFLLSLGLAYGAVGFLSDPLRTQIQDNGRVRRWGFIAEAGKYLRVITEPDGETVHNAFSDRRFKP